MLRIGKAGQQIRIHICILLRNIHAHTIGDSKEIGGILVVVFQGIHRSADHIHDIAAVGADSSRQRHIRVGNVLIKVVEDGRNGLFRKRIKRIGRLVGKIGSGHDRVDLRHQKRRIVVVVDQHQRGITPRHGFAEGLADFRRNVMVPQRLRLLIRIGARGEDQRCDERTDLGKCAQQVRRAVFVRHKRFQIRRGKQSRIGQVHSEPLFEVAVAVIVAVHEHVGQDLNDGVDLFVIIDFLTLEGRAGHALAAREVEDHLRRGVKHMVITAVLRDQVFQRLIGKDVVAGIDRQRHAALITCWRLAFHRRGAREVEIGEHLLVVRDRHGGRIAGDQRSDPVNGVRIQLGILFRTLHARIDIDISRICLRDLIPGAELRIERDLHRSSVALLLRHALFGAGVNGFRQRVVVGCDHTHQVADLEILRRTQR